jgi:tetratricopeptide (TPR) repeat protein
MEPFVRRALLYGGGTVLLLALVYGGFVYRADPDLGTLLSSIDVQLRLAAAMPATDRDGRPLAAREQLLQQADGHLVTARHLAPQSPIVAEFEGFLCNQRGDHRAAAAHYRRARTLPGCTPELRDTLIFNEARMLAAAGDAAAALAVFDANSSALQPVYQDQCRIESASLLHRVGRDTEAMQRLAPVLRSDRPMAWFGAGRVYAELGRVDEADTALERAAATVPIADYDRARLKLAGGDVDSALRLLERAHRAAPAEVGRLLREDATVWQGLATDARFVRLTAPASATPGR